MGIANSLIRISVGIEDFNDLVGDFTQALAASARSRIDDKERAT